MTNTNVAVYAKSPTDHSTFVVVVYCNFTFIAADHTHTSGTGFVGAKPFTWRYSIGEANVFSIRGSTRPAPTVEPVSLPIMRWEKIRRTRFFLFASGAGQHLTFHRRKALLMRLSGSAAAAAPVNFFFIPHIRLRKLSLRDPPSGCGRLMSRPSARSDARPFSLRPPDFDFPAALDQAGVL